MDYMDMDSLHVQDLDQSSASTTTTPTNDYNDYWNHWSPLLHLDDDGLHHNFHSIIDSFLHDDFHSILSPQQDVAPTQLKPYASSPSSDITLFDHHDDFKGLRLVHLLMAAAEAISGGNNSHDLARVILIRLNHLVSPSHPSHMERLASSFTHALHSLLQPPLNNKNLTATSGPHHHPPPMDTVAAFQLLQDMSPYLKFAHFTANQAILEAVINFRRVHIIDFDIMEGIQWASLIDSLSSRPDGLPGPHLRITALSRTGVGGKKSISTVQETGRRLTAFAASVGQPFSFHQCRLDQDETFRPSGLKLVRGEALVFNCILHLPHLSHRPPESVASFLNGAKTLSPRLVTMVEEEDSGPGQGEGGFVGRFMECLHHYSAIYDSLEAGIPMESGARSLVERIYLGPRIARSVARIYSDGGEEERPGSWGEWLGEMGYRGVAMSFSNQCQANLLLGLFNDGFKAEVFGSNKLVLSWRSRRLLSASLWTS